MFRSKKLVAIFAAVAALTIPTLALADDHDGGRRGGREPRRDESAIVIAQLRADIARDKLEIQRDMRMRRWAQVRREQRDLQRDQQQLRVLLAQWHGGEGRGHGGHGDYGAGRPRGNVRVSVTTKR